MIIIIIRLRMMMMMITIWHKVLCLENDTNARNGKKITLT